MNTIIRHKTIIKQTWKPSYYVLYIYIYMDVTCLKEYTEVSICKFEKLKHKPCYGILNL